ncbi:MAG: acyl-CoA dehydratase activase-related protein [Thermodesulfobacteriota bacterium]
MKIGLPRAFYYHSYPNLWECFFRRLGQDVLVSPLSTQKTLEMACAQTETENCLPQKLFDGHVLSLIDSVDILFVPRVLSIVRKHNCCPRFGALPDATRAGIARGVPLLTVEINETREPLSKTLVRLAGSLRVDRGTAIRAAREAFEAMERHHREEAQRQQARCHNGRFLLLGHPYTLHDHFIGEPIVQKLKKLQVPLELMTFGDGQRAPGHILWCVFDKMYGKLQNLDRQSYAGVIQISTFHCGADSMMTERFRRMCRQQGVPYMLLMVDEHTGRAGVDTRLEAFVDSLCGRWTDRAQ